MASPQPRMVRKERVKAGGEGQWKPEARAGGGARVRRYENPREQHQCAHFTSRPLKGESPGKCRPWEQKQQAETRRG